MLENILISYFFEFDFATHEILRWIQAKNESQIQNYIKFNFIDIKSKSMSTRN